MAINEDIQQLTQNAIKSMSKGKSNEALDNYRSALQIAESGNDKQLILSCACNYGAACLVNGKAQEAIDCLTNIIPVGDNIHEDEPRLFILLGDIQYNLGLAHSLLKNWSDAITNLRSAITIFQTLNEERALAEAYQQVAENYVKNNEIPEALEAYTSAGRLYNKSGEYLLETKVLIKQAKLLLSKRKREQCLEVTAKCDKVCERFLECDSGKPKPTKLLYDLAMVHKKLNQLSDCAKWLRISLSDCYPGSGQDELKLQAMVVQLLAKVSVELVEYTKASDLYLKAATLHGQLNNRKSRAWCFYHLGGVYLLLKDTLNAERNYHVAYQMLEDAGYTHHLWKVMEGLGDLNALTYNFGSSITYYKQALSVISSKNTKNLAANQTRLVEKLTSVLEAQKNRIPPDIHIVYKNRKPVVLKMSDSHTGTEYGTLALPTLVASPGAVMETSELHLQSTPIIREPKTRENKSRKSKKKKVPTATLR